MFCMEYKDSLTHFFQSVQLRIRMSPFAKSPSGRSLLVTARATLEVKIFCLPIMLYVIPICITLAQSCCLRGLVLTFLADCVNGLPQSIPRKIGSYQYSRPQLQQYLVSSLLRLQSIEIAALHHFHGGLWFTLDGLGLLQVVFGLHRFTQMVVMVYFFFTVFALVSFYFFLVKILFYFFLLLLLF